MHANWRPTQGSDPAGGDPNAPAPAGGEWRAQLQPEARSRIVNKIMETLKKHLPVSVPEGLNELQKIAVRFEEKIYTAATNQSDYLRKISLKMLSMETKTQQAPGNAQVIPNQNNPGSETQGSDPNAPAPAGGDWQDQFCPEERCRIVDKITTELRRHHPGSEPEALNETQLLAVQFEHEMYTVATSQADYLRKIRLKMLSIETNRRQAPGNAQVIPNQNNPGSAPGLPLQGSNQAQSSAIPLMSQQQARQPNTSTSVQASSLTNIGQNLPGVSQTSTLQNASVMPQNTNE